MRHTHIYGLVALVLATSLSLAGSGPTRVAPAPEPRAADSDSRLAESPLTRDDALRLWDQASKIRETLAVLRAEAPASGRALSKERGQRIRDLNRELRLNLDEFLAAAGLTQEDFVRLLDSDGGLDNGKVGVGEPRIEPFVLPRD